MKNFIIIFIVLLLSVPAFSQSFSNCKNQESYNVFYPESGEKSFKITHSLSETIDPGTSVSCNLNGIHYQNSYYRVFDLSDEFNINSEWIVENLEIGIASADHGDGISQPIQLIFYVLSQYDNEIIEDSLIQKGDIYVFDILDSESNTLKSFDIPAGVNILYGQSLVVEVLMPNGHTDGHSLFIGSNDLGETDYTYIKAPFCGVEEPIPMAEILYPDMHLIMNVYGQYANPTPEILSFYIDGQIEEETEILNEPDWQINLTMLADQDLSALSPEIEIPAGFQIIPASGEEVDFSDGPVTYEVNNEFGKVSQTWEVNVFNAGPDILDVIVTNEVQDPLINNIDHTVIFYIPLGTDLTDISPQIEIYPGFIIDPESESSQDFSLGSLTYTVSHETLDISQDWIFSAEEIEVVDIETRELNDISILPNPAKDYFSVNGNEIEKISVLNIFGDVILQPNNKDHIDVSVLPGGIYLVKIEALSGSTVQKLIISK